MSLQNAHARIQAPDNDLGPAQYRWVNASQDGLVSWYESDITRLGRQLRPQQAVPVSHRPVGW
jgi:hypothetical protein